MIRVGKLLILCLCLATILPAQAGRRGGLSTTLPYQFGIWSDNTSGSAPLLLVKDQLHEISHVHISPDGTKMAWTRFNVYDPAVGFYTENASVAGAETFIANIDGTGKTSLGFNTLNHGNSWWAPDGSGLYFNSSNNPCGNKNGINFYNLSTKVTTTILYDAACTFAYGDPTVTGSGAGTTLVVGGANTTVTNAQSYLFTYNLGTHVLTQLNTPSIPSFPQSGPGPGDYDAKFNHAGTYVATNRHVGVNCYHVVVTKISDGTWTDLTDAGQACPTPQGTLSINANPEFNFADDTIIFWHADTTPANKGIWTIPAAGGSPTHLPIALPISANGFFKMPTWSTQAGLASTIYYSSYLIPLPNAAVPANTVAPSISVAVSATVGTALTASMGTWTNNPTSFACQWFSEGTAIGGATSCASYTPTASDFTNKLTIGVSASNVFGTSAQAFSAVTASVVNNLTNYYICAPSQGSGSNPFNTVGNDSNNGTSPATAWRTIAKLNLSWGSIGAGQSVLFCGGGFWDKSAGPAGGSNAQNYGTVNPPFGKSGTAAAGGQILISRYGTGPSPIIDESADASQAGQWTQIPSTNVWRTVQTFAPQYAASNCQSNTVSNGCPFHDANDIGNIAWSYAALGGSMPATAQSATYGTMRGTHTCSSGCNGAPLIWYGAGEGSSLIATKPLGYWNFNTDSFYVQVSSPGGNPATTMPGMRLWMDSAPMWLNGSNYITIEDLTLQNTANSSALFMRNAGGNITVRDMVIQNIGGGNVGGASSSSSRAGDAFTLFSPYTNMMFERNLIYEAYDVGFTPQGAKDANSNYNNLTIRNNIFHTVNSVFGIDVRPGSGSNTQNGLYIYNNTSYNKGGAWSNQPASDGGQRPNASPIAWGTRFLYDHTVATSNEALECNVFAGLGFTPNAGFGLIFGAVDGGVYYPSQSLGTMAPITINYNLWQLYVPGGGNHVLQNWAGGGGNPTYASWAGTYSFDQQGFIDIDPQFKNTNGNDFTPGNSSPLLGGCPNLGIAWDFNHQMRPTSGNATIGAYQ